MDETVREENQVQTPPEQATAPADKKPWKVCVQDLLKKKWVCSAMAVAVVILAAVIVMTQFVFVAGGMYYVRSATLDLRDKMLTEADYQALTEKLPQCDITWNVPFQNGFLSSQETAVTVSSLTEEDVRMLGYLSGLQTVYAETCQDYLQLAQLQQNHPEVDVRYSVSIGGTVYGKDTRELTLTGLTEEDARNLPALLQLSNVEISGCEDYAMLRQLQREYPQWNLSYAVCIAGQTYPWDYSDLQAESWSAQEVATALAGLPYLKTLSLTNPLAQHADLTALREEYPGVDLSWKVELFGQTFEEDTTEVDISGNIVEACEDVEKLVACLPNLEKLIMSDCGIDSETMAQFRERQRENYKVVWTVYLGNICFLRTDAETFMPYKQGEGYLEDRETAELKYCEDIICMDLGHNYIRDLSFLEYMPKMKYLVLAHTKIRDITPIAACKELVFPEINWTYVQDYSPLVELKKLEDLNLSRTYADVTPLLEMTWLKNLWIPNRPYDEEIVVAALPDTYVEIVSPNTKGWRHLENYYIMRDLLGMHYMSQ